MPSVLQELAGEDVVLNAAHVRERVDDWKTRLSNLYDEIVSWFPNLGDDRSDSVEMNENVMRAYGVASTRLPILRLFAGQDQVAKFIPKGLWIIGANGRVDLFSNEGQFLVVDRSEYFTASRWEIAPALRRLSAEKLSRDSLMRAIP